jgi:phosphatidylglycerophosphate synthase
MGRHDPNPPACGSPRGWLLLSIGVIDMRVRPRVTRFLEPLGKGLAAIGITPAAMTMIGLSVVIVGAVMIAGGMMKWGAAVVFLGSILDGLDGSIARVTGTESARGAFLDSAFDRVGEIAAFAGLAVVSVDERRILLLIVLAVGGAMLVPYMRARAEAAGFNGRGGLMGRAERTILFFLGLVFGLVEPMLWIFVVLVWLTAITRFVYTYRSFE